MSSKQQLDHRSLVRLCCGNAEALDWIQVGRLYCHEIDDLIDEETSKLDKAERTCHIGALALKLYTHPFFLKNLHALKAVMLLNTNNYLDSVKWEESDVPWQRHFSDWARHGWVDVCLVVAEICGGYDNMRNESMEIRSMTHANHKDDLIANSANNVVNNCAI